MDRLTKNDMDYGSYVEECHFTVETVKRHGTPIDLLQGDVVEKLYELEDITDGIPLDRLREMCEAEQDGRCVVLPNGEINNRTTLWYVTKDSYVYKAQVFELGNVIWYYKPKRFYLTRSEAEAALKGDKQ